MAAGLAAMLEASRMSSGRGVAARQQVQPHDNFVSVGSKRRSVDVCFRTTSAEALGADGRRVPEAEVRIPYVCLLVV
jgi:hypothetical protein